ncbi:MAG: HD domain-containing protein [Desulfobacterales bacterium]|jgi:uncharacterized protein
MRSLETPRAPPDPAQLIARYYPPDSAGFTLLITHGRQVAQRALAIARRLVHLNPDLKFIREAALLHDIGIFKTHAPGLGFYGREPYIRHGIIGRDILGRHGLPRHARVAERHVGVGLSVADIQNQHLPLPLRDMRPETLEEEIICYADLFFSKNGSRDQVRSLEAVVRAMAPFGADKTATVEAWARRFEPLAVRREDI